MLTGTIILFGIAAVGGIVLALKAFQGKPLPMPLALVHGVLAATGLVLLALLVMSEESMGLASYSLGLFVIAALGGFGLFSFHLRKKELPKILVGIHGLAAVVAFVLLLAWAI